MVIDCYGPAARGNTRAAVAMRAATPMIEGCGTGIRQAIRVSPFTIRRAVALLEPAYFERLHFRGQAALSSAERVPWRCKA